MTVKKSKKQSKPRKSFADRLEEKLRDMAGVVDVGVLSDKSARWVTLRRGELQVNFSFDVKGDNLQDVGVYQDVIEKVDERKIF